MASELALTPNPSSVVGEPSHLLEVLIMMDKVRQLPGRIYRFDGGVDRLRESRRTTREDTNLTNVSVLSLHESQEGRHVRPAEVVDGLQPCEH